MGIMFDVEAIMNDATLNDLTWEVIEARGIECGDVIKLWETANDLGTSCAECYFQHLMWMTPDEFGGLDATSFHISQTFEMCAKFMAREAREIVKFLKKRNFEFPEGTTGKRPPDAMGI